MPFVQPPPAPPKPTPASPPLIDSHDVQQPVITLQQTGLGLKLRLFFALSCIALVPAIPLALILMGGEKAAMLLSGRNALLCILAVCVAIALVATWVALPVIRPIRRATRQIDATTEEIASLAQATLTIADEHSMGMTIITGASTKLAARRQSIIRDSLLIAQESARIQAHITTLFQALPRNMQTNMQIDVAKQAIAQETTDITKLAHSIATGLENDNSLENLKKAMTNAQDFSQHFKQASTYLQRGAEQIKIASQHLL